MPSSQAPTSTVLHATLEWVVPWRLSVPIFRLSARTRQVSDSIATAVAVSGGLVTQGSVPGYTNGDKTHASFDQGGFVYSMRGRNNSFLNLAFNYSKSRNFDFILGAAGRLNNASSNKLTYQKFRNGASDNGDGAYSQVDHLNANYFNMKKDSANYPATDYMLSREHTGYIGNYDFNISGNIQDRVYLGVTLRNKGRALYA